MSQRKSALALLFPALFPHCVVEGEGGGAVVDTPAPAAGGDKGGEKVSEPSLRDDLNAAVELDEKGDQATDLSEAARKLASARKGAQQVMGDKTVKAAPAADPKAKPAEVVKPEGEKKAEPAKVEAPTHWPAGDRERFTKLAQASPEDATWLLNRHRSMEGDYTRRVQALQPTLRIKETLDEVFKPFKEEMDLAGVDQPTAIRQLVTAHAKLRTDPIEGIKWLANSYGIDLKAAAEGKSADPAADSPAVVAMKNELAELRKWRESVTTGQQTQQHNAALSEVTQFAEAKDAQGNLKHPHFEEVAQDVARLIRAAKQGGEALSLQDAYDRALFANPVTRQKVLAVQDTERKAREEADRKAKADAARKASFDVRGEGAAASMAAQTGSVREDLEAAIASHGGRV